MPTTTYEAAERDYYYVASERYEITRSSAAHDAALVEDVASKIRTTILEQMARLEREAHGDTNLTADIPRLTSFIMEEIGEHLDGPMCSLWHDFCRTLEAAQ